ncbi:MAG TPA: CHASE3 domain-containing protein, partial [Pseudonocardia sp.]
MTTLVVLGWLLGMVALVVLVLVTTDNEEAVDDLLNRVGPARRTASDLLTTVVEEQNSARGFALSGDPARLTAYQAAVLRQEDQVSDLRELVGPDDDQVLDQVHRLVADLGAWRAQGATPLVEAVQRTGPRPPADQTYVLEQRLFAGAMASAHTLVDVTSARRDAAIGGLNGFRRLEMIALIGGALLALLAGVATLRLVRRWVIRPIER